MHGWNILQAWFNVNSSFSVGTLCTDCQSISHTLYTISVKGFLNTT